MTTAAKAPIALPDDAASEIQAHETILRCVAEKTCVALDEEGAVVLTTAAVPMSDLKGGDSRYLSLMRPDICDGISLTLRAVQINTREVSWLGDPVVGSAVVSRFDEIKDKAGAAEIVIARKPLGDRYGLFLFHAGLIRNPPHPENRMDWAKLRLAIVESFDIVSHLSGAPVQL